MNILHNFLQFSFCNFIRIHWFRQFLITIVKNSLFAQNSQIIKRLIWSRYFLYNLIQILRRLAYWWWNKHELIKWRWWLIYLILNILNLFYNFSLLILFLLNLVQILLILLFYYFLIALFKKWLVHYLFYSWSLNCLITCLFIKSYEKRFSTKFWLKKS